METTDQLAQNFSIEVSSIEEKENGVVYYRLECELKDKNKQWQIQKRFAEFEELHLQLTKITLNLPYLPPKSLFKLQNSELKKRKSDLQKYLRALILRPDVISNEIFTEFIQLDKYTTVPKPINYKLLGQIGSLNMNVQDIHYEESQGVIFVLIGENTLKQKITGFLQNFFGTNLKKSQELQGKLICYKSKNQYLFDFQKQWEIQFFSCPTVMAFDDKLCILAVGLYNGDVECYRIQVEKGYQGYEDYCIIKRHTEEVTGIHIDFTNAQVYSTSKDKSLVITNISNSDLQYRVDEKMLENQLTALCLDHTNERVFLGDSVGNIFVYQSIHPFQHITSFKSEFYSTVSSIFISKQKNYILFGFKNGYIRVYELKKKGSEVVINPISLIQGPEYISNVYFSLKHREIYTNCTQNIFVLSSSHNQPIFSINCHKDVINKIRFAEDRQILVTCSKDQSVKFWKLRPSKDDKENEYELLKQIEEQENLKKKQKEIQQKKVESDDEESEEEEEKQKQKIQKHKQNENTQKVEDNQQKQQKQQIFQRKQSESDDEDEGIFGWDK